MVKLQTALRVHLLDHLTIKEYELGNKINDRDALLYELYHCTCREDDQ